VLTEAGVNRSTIRAMISHAMPVSRNSHHGPASRHSALWVLSPMPVRPSAASELTLIWRAPFRAGLRGSRGAAGLPQGWRRV